MPGRKPPEPKEDSRGFKEEVIHQMHVISENVIDQVKLVAEGVSLLNDKVERYREEQKTETTDNYRTLGQAIASLDEKLTNTREGLKIEIQQTRQEFGEKLDQTRQELKAEIRDTRQEFSESLNKARQELKIEIQESRQEILAATKFSYAELDRRLTTLEKEFLDLRLRFDKIESRSAP